MDGRPRVWFVGDSNHGEFVEAVAWLRRHAILRTIRTPSTAASALSAATKPPPLIVLAQSRPGEFAATEVEQLHRAAPLVRLVGLLGGWCEGETRTGKPWPGVERVYWHQWISRCRAEWLQRTETQSTWTAPRTTTPGERFLQMAARPPVMSAGRIAIACRQLSAYEPLRDACQSAGMQTVWVRDRSWFESATQAAVDALVLDGSVCQWLDAQPVDQWPFGVIGLLDFPRLSDVERARARGMTVILSKPFLVDDLLVELAGLTQRVRGRSPAA